MPAVPPGAGWVTYVRCHDDIGWTITPEDAAAVGEDAHLHRRFLSDFYAGDFPGTFARGARFQPDAATGEARTSGMTASLAGLEAALRRRRARARAGDPAHAPAPRRRVRARRAPADLHGRRARAAQRSGAGRRTRTTATTTAGCTARRWTGRRPSAGASPGSVEAALWDGLRRLIAARRATRATHAQGAGRAAVDGQRPRLRAAAHVRRRTAAGARELQRRRAAVRDAIVDEHGLALNRAGRRPRRAAAARSGRGARPRAVSVLLAPLALTKTNAPTLAQAPEPARIGPSRVQRRGVLHEAVARGSRSRSVWCWWRRAWRPQVLTILRRSSSSSRAGSRSRSSKRSGSAWITRSSGPPTAARS